MKQKSVEMKNKCFVWLMAILLMVPIGLSAQEITVKGNVTDSTGEGVIGASVVEKGNAGNGTITDINGDFTLKVSGKGKKLVISYIGMQAQEIDAVAGKTLSIKLQDDSKMLDEVVVVGYGTMKKKDLTGSVSSMNDKVLKDIPVTSALQAMSGHLAGVNVTVTDGSPDAEIKVRVRGGGSITQDNSPLYIVDGFIVKNINDIPPGDIQDISVLKDASSTAIYGAKGANGVVLVTTKSGKAGKTVVDVNSYVGIKKTYNLTDVLSPYEYVYYQKEIDSSPNVSSAGFYSMYGMWDDIDLYKYREGIDWQDQLYGNTGVQKNFNVSLSGGTETMRYNISYTRDDEDYIMLNSNYVRDNFNIKLNKSFGKVIDLDVTARTTNTVIDGPDVSGGRKLRDGVKYAPVKSITTLSMENLVGTSEELDWAESASMLNDPIYNITNEFKKQYSFVNSYNVGLTFHIIKGLDYRVQGSYSYEKAHTDNIWLKKTGESNANGGQPVAKREYTDGYRFTIQNHLTYDFTVAKDHRFNIMFGQEIFSGKSDKMTLQSKFFPKDFTAEQVLAMWNYGEPLPAYNDIGEPSRTSSFFGRLNYTLKDRYYLTFTAREDGTNVFAPGKQWGFFPAGALAWRLSEEPFMEATKSWLSNAKLRLSYGQVGNARVGSYWRQQYSFESSANRLYYIGEKVQSGLKPTNTLRNENLTWETKTSANIGLDLGFFNDKVNVVIDAYKDVTKDLILAVDIPTHSGYGTQYRNLGQTTNKGVELTANWYAVETKDFNLSLGFNISFNRNTVDKLDGSDSMIATSGWGVSIGSDDYRAIVGKSIGQIYGYKQDGFYSFDDFTFNEETKRWIIKPGVADCSDIIATSGNWFGPGHMKLKKLTDDGSDKVTTNDRTVIGNAMPKHTGGFNINADYKGIDFGVQFNWSYGNDILNANKIDNTTYAGSKKYQNLSSDMALDKRFTTIDPETGYNIMYGEYANPARLQEINQNATIWHPLMNSTVMTDYAIEDGSFLRLSNLTIGYTLPKAWTKKFLVEKLRVYFTGYNLHCWTKYSGQDPEVDTRRSTPLTPGVDYSAYPKAHSFLFGINLTL